jgi:D-sedoheptulose 7-phosphate isomerase
MITQLINEHIAVFQEIEQTCQQDIIQVADLCRKALASGRKILFMGNGGSAADSQHLAAELVGRFKKERRGLAAIALTTDTSILTAVGNDYGYDQIFARQVEALAVAGDVVIGLSTSGNSPNVVNAIQVGKVVGTVTVGMAGQQGGHLSDICDVCIKVPSTVTARIQEGHIFIGHLICHLIDED